MAQALVDSEFESLVRTFLRDREPVQAFEPTACMELDLEWHPDDDVTAASADSPSRHDWSVPGSTPSRDTALSPAIAQVQAALASLAASPTSGRAADVSALLTASEQLRGLALRAVAEMDATGSHLPTGSPTTSTWLRDALVISDVAARAKVRLATTLRDELPRLEQQLCEGRTTVEHASAVVTGTRGLDPTIVAETQDALCDLVRTAEPQTVREQLRERAEALDPELGRDAERRAHARRGLTADTVANGLLLGGSAGIEDGQVILHGLDLAVEADRQDGDARSLRQRRLDVLVQWSREAVNRLAGPAGSVADDLRTTRTHLLLTCTAEQLAASRRLLEGVSRTTVQPPAPGSAEDVAGPAWPWGCPAGATADTGARVRAGASFGPDALVSSEVLRRLTCDAALSLAVVPDASQDARDPLGLRPDPTRRRDPLYVGRAARIVTASQWKALVLRDRRCVVKGCRRRPSECQAHHVRHWLEGGPTDLDNLVLLCHQHHHDHHDRGHDLQHRDGRWMTSAGWGAQAPP